ncbi:MAG TPA: phosphotransferase [Cryptosporangiaceae bacterium]|nr:phosphotransferase [Cryptosporangiaceae bacterium]
MLFTELEPASDEAMLGLVHEVSPALVPGEVLHRSATSFVVAGTIDFAPVVAKVLANGSPFWGEQFRREIEAYRIFEHNPPPVRVPRLVAADQSRAVLVTERLFGRPVTNDRHPTSAIPSAELAGAFTQVRRLNAWRPGLGQSWQVDYGPRIERAHRQRLLDDDDRAAVLALAERAAGQREFAHGDLVLNNVLKIEGGFGFVDWAAAGEYLPGFDLAQLWVLLGELHGPRLVVEDMVGDGGPDAEAPFLVNLALLLGRELRTFRHHTDRAGQARYAHLADAWADVRDRLRRAAGH